jgi:glycosyltransferase involved in cell wall biosynthesis
VGILAGLYGFLCFIAFTNYVWMRRPRLPCLSPDESLAVLIPARNEAHNLREFLPQLTPYAKVIVFDDESDDGTGEVAASLGATVITPAEVLPKGWTGKNRACHELGLAAAQTGSDWWIFLDADVRVTPDFFDALCSVLQQMNPKVGCITGFPQIRPGRFPEPLFLAWVGWILLATNPFGVVSKTGKGHNRFTNGQITVWRPEVWQQIRPNEVAKSRVLEDVVIGRLLAKEGVPVEVANLSTVMSVKMYDTWRETLDGMSKNSYEIMNSYLGTALLALLLLFIAWGWLLWLPGYLLLVASGYFAFSVCRGRAKLDVLVLLVFLMPIMVSLGSLTMFRSMYWKSTKRTAWKGRIYT